MIQEHPRQGVAGQGAAFGRLLAPYTSTVSSNSKMQEHFSEETLNSFISFPKRSMTRGTLRTLVLGPNLLQEVWDTCRRNSKTPLFQKPGPCHGTWL